MTKPGDAAMDTATMTIARTHFDETRYGRLIARDAAEDGRWFYAVKTTGVYCRPSCASRPPLRRNVAFFATPAEAEAAGYRPCKRCRPTEISADAGRLAAVERACRLIERSDTVPSLAALAAAAHMSPYHFHRTFRRVTGTTPARYARSARVDRLASELGKGNGTVTAAIYDSGYGSGGRAYADAKDLLGLAPGSLRAGGDGLQIRYGTAETPLGWLMLAASDTGVISVKLGDRQAPLVDELRARFPRAAVTHDDAGIRPWLTTLAAAIESGSALPDLPLDLRGTAFPAKEWELLRAIPRGETRSYAEVATAAGNPAAVRAVARACASNEIALLVPCHRVVRTDGTLGGYRWGEARKKKLLAAERTAAS
jgi:AraC family transcriptional regulator of adaptative response/methylated-DNA-[protein]-cysteine methyltransferase